MCVLLLSCQEDRILATAAGVNVEKEIEQVIVLKAVTDVKLYELPITIHLTILKECGLLKRAD